MVRRDVLKGGLGLIAATTLAGAGRPSAPALAAEADAFHRMRRFADIAQGRIAYVEQGTGPAAIFLHGWPLNGFHWRGSMAKLSAVRRCIAPDFMGLGYTEVSENQDLSPVAQRDMILAFMDYLGIESAEIVANDSGTTVAQLIAASAPARVRSLLLTNGDVHTNSPPEALKPAIEAARQGMLADMFERHLEDLAFAHSPEGLGGICYGTPSNLTAQSIQVYIKPLLQNDKRRRQCQAYGVAFEPNPLPAIEQALRRYPSPARMIWGTADILFSAQWAEWLDRTLPRSRGVRLLPGGKLFFPEEHPDLIVEEAAKLWSSASDA